MRPAETYLQNYKNWAALWYTLVILILVPQEYLKNTSHSVHCWCVVKKPGHACVSIGQDWSASVQDTGHYWPAAGAVIGQDITDQSQFPSHWSAELSSAGQCVSSPHSPLALTSQTPFTNLNSTSSGRFIVIALPCLLFDKVISMRYPWIKVFKSAHEVPIYDFVARYRLWGDGAASHKENIILWPSNNPTQMWL